MSGTYPNPGESIGPYRIVRQLGRGGMGIVFEALDVQLNRAVALKIISPHLADDPTFRARFTHEAQAQARLDSSHVVHVYAHGEVDGRLYIATQLIPNGDLGAMLTQQGAPPFAIALDMMAQIAGGLSDAHAAGLIHRDIKPANVLLRFSGPQVRAYLADFGIARQVSVASGLTTAGATVGTPSYMAPELHTGGQPGIPTDIYSLGCLLWVTLTGNAPYAGTSDFQIIQSHLENPVPQLMPTAPAAATINGILRGCLAKNPQQRYPSAARLRQDLEEAARQVTTGLPGTAPRPATPVAHPPQPRTNRAPLIVGLVALLVLIGIGVGVAVAVAGGDDGSERAGEETTSATDSTPTEATSSATDPTTEPSSPTLPPPPSSADPSSPFVPPTLDYKPKNADEQTAYDSLYEAFEGQGLTEAQADCVAGTLIVQLGLPLMVDAGLLTEGYEFNDTPSSDVPQEVTEKVISATVSCALV